MSNIQRSQQILRALAERGVKEIVVCAGARNAPFVSVLAKARGFRIYSFFEERSAAFFALGRMQVESRPVVVLTTSGTAAAELLPALIECDYSGYPLIALTADRPKSYRGTGAPQTIEQPGLYSHYVENSWDLEANETLDLSGWSGLRPCHINVCFDEPLVDEDVSAVEFETGEFKPEVRVWAEADMMSAWNQFQAQVQRPVVMVGGLRPEAATRVLPLLKSCGRPLYLEAHSQLRGHPELRENEILAGESALASLDFDGVIRVGSVCTVRTWRDLEKSEKPVIHFSDLPFTGLTRGSLFPLEALEKIQWPESWARGDWQNADRESANELSIRLRLFNRSEPGVVHALSQMIPENSNVFLGNSLPIREWDLAADRDKKFHVFANRGVNGIDGLISTFIGLADPERENWAILGDLTTLYDLAGPWAARVREMKNLNLVIINNGGGKIFSRIFNDPLFENPHALQFRGFAELWHWDYQRVESVDQIRPGTGRPRVIEVVPDPEQTEEFWQ